ncbi:MAG: hypothetical protein Q4C49_11695 [Bacillota bacterium]|nr:hypothetical protein [Bacillota bacterium]
METLYLILIGSLIIGTIILILIGLWKMLPFIFIAWAILYVYKRFFKKQTPDIYDEKFDETYYTSFGNDSSSRNMDVIDVEYTEHEEEND